ncbi:MAG TPA: hypothetical protein VF796_24770 [Humisphaera sp.]
MTDPTPDTPAQSPAPPPSPPDESPPPATSSAMEASAEAPAPDDGTDPALGLELREPPADALEHVVDDYVDRDEPTRWAAAQLLAGKSFEEVEDALAVQGWGPEDVLQIVEDARERTKRERGVTVREDVIRLAYRKHRISFRRMRWYMILTLAVLGVAAYLFVRRGEMW